MAKTDYKSIRINSDALPKLRKISRENGISIVKTIDKLVEFYRIKGTPPLLSTQKQISKNHKIYDIEDSKYLKDGFYYRVELDNPKYAKRKNWKHPDSENTFTSLESFRAFNHNHNQPLNHFLTMTDEEVYSIRLKLFEFGCDQFLASQYHERRKLSGFINGRYAHRILRISDETKELIRQNIPSLEEVRESNLRYFLTEWIINV